MYDFVFYLDGTGEFLDSWLALVEKMINPKAVMESPHTLPPKNKTQGFAVFNPVQYLVSTQKVIYMQVYIKVFLLCIYVMV